MSPLVHVDGELTLLSVHALHFASISLIWKQRFYKQQPIATEHGQVLLEPYRDAAMVIDLKEL